MSFLNKVVVVTGSSSGIGAAIAIKFAHEGANVVINGRNVEKLTNVSKECEKGGKKPLVVTADISKDDDIKKILDETISKYGKLDILVNNAGIGRPGPLSHPAVMKVYDEVMNTNIRSVVYLTHLAYPHIVKSKGNIINISSVGGQRIFENQAMFTYTMSKAALDHFTKCAAAEFALVGVRVNAICPGPVKTDIADNAGVNADDFWTKMIEGTALNRISQPEEIAHLALFLASDNAEAITGTCVVTDNGYLLKK